MNAKLSLSVLALVMAVFAACGGGPRDLSDRDNERLIPRAEDFQILRLRIDGQDCKVAYAFIESRSDSSTATGGPFVISLGCNEEVKP